MDRQGDWIQTAMGRQFWPMDPRAEDVDIQDVAKALSLLCRFGGHCSRFYSVAEHSVLLASKVAPENRFWALLHDASEAYLVDVPRPIKRFLGGYTEAEDKIMAAVCEHFGLTGSMPAEVKEMDTRILTDERQQNMAPAPKPWSTDAEPIGVTLQFWQPVRAKKEWLQAVREEISSRAMRQYEAAPQR